MEMATGQPRIEVSIGLIIFVDFCSFTGILLIDLIILLWILATVFEKKPLIHCLVYFNPNFDLQTAAIPNNTNDDLQKGYHTWCCLNLSTDSSHYVSFIPWSVRIPLSVNTGYSIFLVQLWKDKHTEF